MYENSQALAKFNYTYDANKVLHCLRSATIHFKVVVISFICLRVSLYHIEVNLKLTLVSPIT